MDLLAEFGGLSSITAGATLVLVVIAIVRGKLIPEAMHHRITEAKDQQIATLTRATDRQAGQVDKLVEQGESTLKILQAIKLPTEGKP